MSQLNDNHDRSQTDQEPGPNERTSGNSPALKKRFDRVDAAIWRHKSDKGEAYFSVTFSRSYWTDNQGKKDWHDSPAFYSRDLPHLGLAIDWAMKELLLKSE